MSQPVVVDGEDAKSAPRKRSRRLTMWLLALGATCLVSAAVVALGYVTKALYVPGVNVIFVVAIFAGIIAFLTMACLSLINTRFHALGIATLWVFGIALVIFICAWGLPLGAAITTAVCACTIAGVWGLSVIVLGVFVDGPGLSRILAWTAVAVLFIVGSVFLWRVLTGDPDEPSVLHAAWFALIPIAAAVVAALLARARRQPMLERDFERQSR